MVNMTHEREVSESIISNNIRCIRYKKTICFKFSYHGTHIGGWKQNAIENFLI